MTQYKQIPVEIPIDLKPLVPGFLRRRDEELSILKQHVEAQDMSSISSVAHKLKGHGTAYGFEAISLIGKEMEQAAKSNDIKTVSGLLKELEDVVKYFIRNYGE